MAKKAMVIKQQRAPKFSTRAYKMQSVRQTPLCTEKIWYLPYLLPRTGIQGPDSGRKESKLVNRKEEFKCQ